MDGVRRGAGRPVAAWPTGLLVALLATALTTGCTSDSRPADDGPSGGASSSAPPDEPTVLEPTPVPEVTGDTRNGETLTGHAGSWGPGDVTLSFRWRRDGADIQGAVERTYALTSDDVGHRITLRVTGSKPGYEPVAQESPAVGPVLRATMASVAPQVVGEPVFGTRLGVGGLDWGSSEVRFRYQWLRDGVPVPGRTRAVYHVGLPDLDHRITVEVTGRLAGFDPAVQTSAPTEPARTARFEGGSRPRLTGTPRYFDYLTVSDPGWRPRPVLTYQWLRDGAPVTDVSGPTYQLRGRDIGHRISVQVTGSRDGYTPRQQVTLGRGPVGEGRLEPSPKPTVSGTVAVDRYLTASAGEWGPAPVDVAWQWFRDGRPIRGATDSSYRLTVSDLDQRLWVDLVATSEYFQPAKRTSEPTDRVAPGDLTRTPTPLYHGIAQVGRTIKVLPREWGPGRVDLAFQWFRGRQAIRGATERTYVVAPADEGRLIRVRVTGSEHGYRPVSRISGYTDRIALGDLAPGLPVLTGQPVLGETLALDPGEWGPGKVRLDYQWFRDGEPLDRAVGEAYTLSQLDVGHLVSVRVTGHRRGYATVEAWSAALGPVLPPTA